jgi:hypothetical protein
MTAHVLWSLLCGFSVGLGLDDSPPDPTQIRHAIERAIPLLLASAAEYPQHRDCFSCHHQAVPMVALTLARGRGFPVPDDALSAIVTHTENDLVQAAPSYREGRGQGGGSTRAGYALWTLQAGGFEPDETTRAVVQFLLRRDAEGGPWKTSSNRPPSEASSFTSTYVALRGLASYATEEDEPRVARRRQRARTWLLETAARDTEDRVFRLLALQAAGAEPVDLAKAVDELLAQQRADGGWSQRHGIDQSGDAYATGSALYALHQAGGLSTEHPAYAKGLAHLIRTQEADGSWHVVSRSKPFQTYFESGFPHGRDQFISIAASAWATAALTLAVAQP